MVEIKYLKNNPDGNPQFPMKVWDKKVAVALLDFRLFPAQKNIQMFKDATQRGSYVCTYQESYDHLLDTLDNLALEKGRWEREVGTLQVLEDINNNEVTD